MSSLAGRVALVTGAARGQGRAHATLLAREGADVVALDVDGGTDLGTVPYDLATATDLAETARSVEAQDRRVLARTADVRSNEQLATVVTEALDVLGRIDVLVANAGVFSPGSVAGLDDRTFADVLGVDLLGVWRSMKAVVPHREERGSGSLVLVSSVNGHIGNAAAPHYAAAKHGVLGMMRGLHIDHGDDQPLGDRDRGSGFPEVLGDVVAAGAGTPPPPTSTRRTPRRPGSRRSGRGCPRTPRRAGARGCSVRCRRSRCQHHVPG